MLERIVKELARRLVIVIQQQKWVINGGDLRRAACYWKDQDASLHERPGNGGWINENGCSEGVRPEGHPAPFVVRTNGGEQIRIEVNEVSA